MLNLNELDDGFDPIQDEHDYVLKHFKIEDVLNFSNKHNVEVLRGEDWQYYGYVNRQVLGLGFTPMYALLTAIIKYKERHGI